MTTPLYHPLDPLKQREIPQCLRHPLNDPVLTHWWIGTKLQPTLVGEQDLDQIVKRIKDRVKGKG